MVSSNNQSPFASPFGSPSSSPFGSPFGTGTNDDLLRLVAEARARRSKLRAQETASALLQPFSSVSNESIARLEQENMLKDFQERVRAATPEQDESAGDSEGTFRPVSGLLGTIFEPFQRFQNIIEGTAGTVGALAQVAIPGEQSLERRVRELREEGVGPFAAREQAFEEQKLPSVRVDVTPGFDIPLPGGRKLDEVDFGVKGAIELIPDVILLGTGVGIPFVGATRAGRLLQKGVIPGTIQWMRGAKAASQVEAKGMSVIARRIEEGVPSPGSGVLSVPAPAKGSTYETYLKTVAAAEAAAPAKSGIRATVGGYKAYIAEALFDQYDQVAASASRAKKESERLGVPFNDSMNAELHANLLQGAVSAGTAKAKDAVQSALRFVKGSDSTDLRNYLRLRHLQDVVKMHPTREPIKGFTSNKQIDVALEELKDLIGNEQFNRVQLAAKQITNVYQEALDNRVRSGLVDAVTAKELKEKYPFYNPMYHIKETDGILDDVAAPPFSTSGRAINVTKNDLERLSNLGVQAVTEDPLETIFHALGRAELLIRRNDAAHALVDQMLMDPLSKAVIKPVRTEDLGKIGNKATLSFMSNGVRQTYIVPTWAQKEARSFAITEFGSLETIGRALNALPRALLVNYNPAFLAANFVFDMMTIAVTKNIMPWTTLNAARKNLTAVFRDDPVLSEMMKSGGDVSGYWGRDVRDQVKDMNKGGNLVVRTSEEHARLFKNPRLLFQEIAHSLELSPRRAVFEKSIARGNTNAQAALAARRGTVDFQRGGRMVRALNSYFLFLNPAVQGTMLPFRAAFTGSDRTRAMLGMSGLLGANAAVYAHNMQYPEYADIPAFDRLGKLIFMLPSEEKDSRGNTVPHYIAMVPMLREFTALTAPMNHILDRMRNENPETFQELIGAIIDQSNPVDPISRLPVPTYFGQAYTEWMLNRDTFRDRPIVPPELEGLPVPQQFNERTSDVAIRLGGWLNLSPMKIDHVMTSGLGKDIFALADMNLREQLGENVEAQIVAAQLAEVSDTVSPTEYRRLRNLVLADLDAETRRAVEREERRPEPDIPIATSVMNRFYRRYGGNLYRTGLQRAAEAANITTEQMQNANNILHQVDIELQDAQIKRDQAIANGDITGNQWRQSRKESGTMYRGALMALGVNIPPLRNLLNDPAARTTFYDTVNTVAGYFPDKRDRAQLLVAGLNAIPVPEIAPGVDDWPEYFSARNTYISRLSEEDRKELEAERQDSLTSEERYYNQFTGDLGQATVYWNVPEFVIGEPVIAREFRVFETLAGIARETVLAQRPQFAEYARQVTLVRENMRLGSPDLDAFLLRYGYIDKASPANEGREDEIAPWMSKSMLAASGI